MIDYKKKYLKYKKKYLNIKNKLKGGGEEGGGRRHSGASYYDSNVQMYLVQLTNIYQQKGGLVNISWQNGMIDEVYLYPKNEFDINNHVHIYYYEGRWGEQSGWSYHYTVCDGYDKLHFNKNGNQDRYEYLNYQITPDEFWETLNWLINWKTQGTGPLQCY